MEALRQYTNDGHRLPIQIYRLAENILESAISLLPRAVAEQSYAWRRLRVFVRMKVTPQHRRHAQCLKEPRAYAGPVHRLIPFRRLHHEAEWSKHLQRTERLIGLLPIEIVEVGKMKPRPQRRALVKLRQPRRILIRQRLDQSRIDKAKNGDARADTEGQDENCRHGKPGILAQLPQCKAKILQHALKPERHRLVALVSQAHIIPEATIRGMPGIV